MTSILHLQKWKIVVPMLVSNRTRYNLGGINNTATFHALLAYYSQEWIAVDVRKGKAKDKAHININ